MTEVHDTIEYNNRRDLGTDSEDTSQGSARETSNMAQPGKILGFRKNQGKMDPLPLLEKNGLIIVLEIHSLSQISSI